MPTNSCLNIKYFENIIVHLYKKKKTLNQVPISEMFQVYTTNFFFLQ